MEVGTSRSMDKNLLPFLGVPFGQPSLSWVTKQIRGQRVAVIGYSDASLLVSLVEQDFKVTAYGDPSSVEQAQLKYQNMPIPLQEALHQVNFSPWDGSSHWNGTSKPVDTVIITDLSRDGEKLKSVIESDRNPLGRKGRCLVVILPEFISQRYHQCGVDLESFLALVRPNLIPEHLSIENGELRFVGQFTRPSRHHWGPFESKVWFDLMGETLLSAQVRHYQELNRLQQSTQATHSSASYRIGSTLVAMVERPWTLWLFPVQLVAYIQIHIFSPSEVRGERVTKEFQGFCYVSQTGRATSSKDPLCGGWLCGRSDSRYVLGTLFKL